MKFTGENVLAVPVEKAWDALLDPAVLVRTIPGCERLEATGENAYAMTVTAGVASIKGTYAGSCVLTDLVEHESLVMKLDGAGAPGTIGATVNVRFTPDGSSTRVSYDADAVVAVSILRQHGGSRTHHHRASRDGSDQGFGKGLHGSAPLGSGRICPV